jgi:hypothetical protein
LNYKQKKDKLAKLSDDIVDDDIPFSSNLIDMVYAMYPVLESARLKEQYDKK